MAVPTAPATVVATPGNGSATVSWTAPSSDGGSAIVGYLITPTNADTDTELPEVLSCGNPIATRIMGLTNDTRYKFTVKAFNADGTGTESAFSNTVTPGPAQAIPTGYSLDWLMEFGTADWTLSNAAGTVTNSNAKALWNLMVNARQGSTNATTGLWSGTQSYSLAENVETDTSARLLRLKADDVDTGTGSSLRAYSSAYIRTQSTFYQPLEGRYEARLRFPLAHSVWPCMWFTAYGSASRFEVDWPETFTADTPGRASLVFHSGDGSSGSYGGSNLIGKAWMGNAWTWHIPSGTRKFTGPNPGSTRYGKAIDLADPTDPDNPPWVKASFEVERVWNQANTRYTIRMKFYLDDKLICTYLDPFNPETGIGPSGQNATGWSGNYPKWVHDSFTAGATLNSFWCVLFDNWVGGAYVGKSVANPTTPSTYGSRVYDYTGTYDNGSAGAPAADVPDASANRWPFYLDVAWVRRLAKS